MGRAVTAPVPQLADHPDLVSLLNVEQASAFEVLAELDYPTRLDVADVLRAYNVRWGQVLLARLRLEDDARGGVLVLLDVWRSPPRGRNGEQFVAGPHMLRLALASALVGRSAEYADGRTISRLAEMVAT
jgi:hypothetical protein